ncbi:uncharacterized protein MELLADRAFT_107264 [Melampsora larici-populina 98AG31]|uniref:Uncharacterized protein n=1 Tax=Melampsora larici-populina (strain 98AG31 / pathotype 3-4-7) TaxID=747676 RepID=F4RPD5_MELLP|nr:uncharacterized protein MELLADRAFT_107264 [Melampsora larici-populina 98AG31]EGG05798.1 hypothetical protein MELLADRAFT_107264 [Melampsora larici-populina 98AG31]
MSSSLTTQLCLWREIVTELHETNHPVDQNPNFMEKRFEELDSKGFIWSKESILSAFLQLRLPKSVHDHDRVIEPRDIQVTKNSSIEVKDIIQIGRLELKRQPIGLMDLPIEVFDNILKVLDCIAQLEDSEIYKERKEGEVVISGPGTRAPYATYLYPHLPILNSKQTFSVTSRKMYQLCRPWLWRKLQFPTSLPAPIDLWTKDILLKQGSYVKSLSLFLSENCSESPGSPYSMKFMNEISRNTVASLPWIKSLTLGGGFVTIKTQRASGRVTKAVCTEIAMDGKAMFASLSLSF